MKKYLKTKITKSSKNDKIIMFKKNQNKLIKYLNLKKS